MSLGSVVLIPIRVVQVLSAATVLGCSTYALSVWPWRSTQLVFIIFCSAWTIFVPIYLLLAPLAFDDSGPRAGYLALDCITMIFWLSAWITVATWLGTDIGCGWGGVTWVGCRTIIAGEVFASFLWLLFLATTVASAIRAAKHDDDDLERRQEKENMHQTHIDQPNTGGTPALVPQEPIPVAKEPVNTSTTNVV